MPIEIERKFLVNDQIHTLLDQMDRGFMIQQGYLQLDPERTVRLRIKNEQAFLTIKGKTEGIMRKEFEYEIPLEDARELLPLCVGKLVEKVRYEVHFANLVWELDVFKAANAGLILAEVELNAESEEFELPDWVGEEVSEDPRFFNAYLAAQPFTTWK